MQIFIFLALLITIVIVLFAVQNAALVTITFLTFHFEGSLAFVLVVVFALGILSGMLIMVPSFWRKSSLAREQRKKMRQLEERAAVQNASHTPPGKEGGIE